MTTDKTTKLLLLFIALGLWANMIAPLFFPRVASAQSDSTLRSIDSHLDAIYSGTCTNGKIC
jgi:hypothetical protein